MSISALLGRHLRRPHTPLGRLPMMAIDYETTGLAPRRDHIISFAAIRIVHDALSNRPVTLAP